MFSTAQLDIMRSLVAQMRDKGYTYYIAVQNAASSVSYDYNMFIYFSDQEITSLSQYLYTLPAATIKYSIRSGNASSSHKENRVEISFLSSETDLEVDTWQFISTNTEFSTGMIVPDYTFTEVHNFETNALSSFMLVCVVMLVCIFQMFRR